MFQADAKRIETHLRRLNEYNSTPEFGTTRVLFTEPELEGRSYIIGLMKELGLEVTQDNIGNIFGVLKGTDSALAPVWTGSHCDTVLNAGMFDGMAGVIGGIEALRQIKESGLEHKRDIAVVMYTSEEPTRFGLSCLGSRALCGKLTAKDAKELFDKDGKTLWQVLKDLGCDADNIGQVQKKKGDVFAAVELHIEQSSSLEKAGKTIGAVKTICAPANYEITIKGVQSHAGGTSMADRRDAFTAGCALALELERLARQSSAEYVTATVGRVNVVPGAVNVIPGEVQMSVDIRYTDIEALDEIMYSINEAIARTEKERGVSVTVNCLNRDIPAHCDKGIISSIKANCERYGYSYKDCISGAYHDSLMVNAFAPVAMIFVPSRNGISHSPEEWTDFEDIAKGTNILAEVLLETANGEA